DDPAMQALAAITALVIIAIAWRYQRFQRMRRDRAEDRQAMLHSPRRFHVLLLFRLHVGDKLLPTAADFMQAVRGSSSAGLVYAGHAGFALDSAQLGERRWNGVLLLEFPGRDEVRRFTGALRQLAGNSFAEFHLHGMVRDRRTGLLIPLLLLGRRLLDSLRGEWRVPQLTPSAALTQSGRSHVWRNRVERLRALHKINPRALVMFSLVRHDGRVVRRSEREYSRRMLSRMAALGHGPLHSGRAVCLGGGARFDDIHVVHYPSAGYVADLVSSGYYQRIVADTSFEDATAIATVPVTVQLEAMLWPLPATGAEPQGLAHSARA
ncbi:MAG: hypothetical protein R3228_13905, partial [Halioglobus sp.]|nr:hypothetical protein [Halioglobus sp.]